LTVNSERKTTKTRKSYLLKGKQMAKGDEIQERLIIAVKELSESEVWLRMVVTSNMLL